MDKSDNNLSFTKIRSNRPAIACRLLYAGYAENRQARSIAEHRHDFWQFELVLDGPAALEYGGGERELNRGTAIFIPPGLPHRFHYRGPGARWWSLKFVMDGPEPGREAVAVPVCAWLTRALELLDMIGTRLDGGGGEEQVVLAQLEALLELIAVETFAPASDASDSGPVGRIEARLAQSGGRRLSVKTLADELGYSPEYLSSRYRRKTGGSLKEALDRRLLAAVRERLFYTHLTSAELAEELGFPDVYTFCKFVRRMTGKTPGQMRKMR